MFEEFIWHIWICNFRNELIIETYLICLCNNFVLLVKETVNYCVTFFPFHAL